MASWERDPWRRGGGGVQVEIALQGKPCRDLNYQLFERSCCLVVETWPQLLSTSAE